MKYLISVLSTVCVLLYTTTAIAQLNSKPLEDKGFEVKYKFKPYKKTHGNLLKLKVKNATVKSAELTFQLYLYVDGKAEIMSEKNSNCLGPNKKGKNRFLFESKLKGTKTIEFEKLEVKVVDICDSAK